MTRAKEAFHVVHDGWPDYGIVRCADDNIEAYERLAVELLDKIGLAENLDASKADLLRVLREKFEPPRWRYLRCNPDFTGEYGWLLGTPDGPGPGTFRGVIVTRKREAAS